MKVRVTNIQRFSLNDGPGIRTTVFFKGCALRCPWCSNPENINFNIESYYNSNSKQSGFFGYNISLDELYNEIIKDENYYRLNNGGVTFSGGEALLQFDKLEHLLNKLKKEKINMCIETSLFASLDNLKIAIDYMDEFIVDVKILDYDIYNNILKGDLDIYLKNVDYLFNNFKGNIMFRIPITKEYTLNNDNLSKIIRFVKKYEPNRVEIFKVHKLGESKYKSLNRKMQYFDEISDEEMNLVLKNFKNHGLDVVECKI